MRHIAKKQVVKALFMAAFCAQMSLFAAPLANAQIFPGGDDQTCSATPNAPECRGFCVNNPQASTCDELDCYDEANFTNPLCVTDTEGGLEQTCDELDPSGLCHTRDIGTLIIKFVNFSLPYLAIAAFLAFVAAGFMYVTAFGNEEQIGKAKTMMIWAAIGLLVVIASYTITAVFTVDLVENLQSVDPNQP